MTKRSDFEKYASFLANLSKIRYSCNHFRWLQEYILRIIDNKCSKYKLTLIIITLNLLKKSLNYQFIILYLIMIN